MIDLNNIPGLEAINFKEKSRVFEELTKVLATGQSYIDRHWTKDKSSMTFYHEFKVFFDKKISQQIKKVLRDNFNLNLSGIRTIEPTYTCGMFAITLDDKDSDNFFYEILETSSGTYSYKETQRKTFWDELMDDPVVQPGGYKKTSVDDYADVVDALNVKKGEFDKKKLGALNRFNWTMFIDLGIAYFNDKLNPGAPKFEYEEIAAILLHEVGHVITSVENLGKFIYFTDMAKVTANGIEKEEPAEASKKLDKALDRLEGIIKAGNVVDMDKDISKLRKFINNINDAINFATDNTPLKYLTRMLTVIFVLLSNAIFYCLGGALIFYVAGILESLFINIESHLILRNKDKKSDETYSSRNNYNIERRADEFVSRLGAGSHLAEALNKLDRTMDLMMGSKLGITSFDKANQNSTIIQMTIAGMTYFDNVIGLPKGDTNQYEDTLARMKRLLQNNMVVFKDKNLSAKVRDRYIKDSERIMKIIRNEESKTHKKIGKFLTTYLIPLSLPANLLEVGMNGKLSKDYESLFKELEDLVNNKSFYHSQKLKSFL